jgi:putative ABC transport system permease protein
MHWSENIRLAFRALRANKLRSSLTLLIIALGIMALVGILTATEGIKFSLLKNFAEMGSNTLSVRREGEIRRHGGRRRSAETRENPVITFEQARGFKKQFHYPAATSVSAAFAFQAEVKCQSKKTNPNVKVIGGDENYLQVSGLSVEYGRNFTLTECDQGTDVIIIGRDIANALFIGPRQALQQMVNIGSKKYRVVGILASKGSSMFKSDNQVIVPVLNGKRTYGTPETTYMISSMVKDATRLEAGIAEARGAMRNVRKLRIQDADNFSITKSDRIAMQALEQLSYVKVAAIVIGILTLLGAGVGLMNIMLVAVNERTREIGVSKALGASGRVIRMQFLSESIFICLAGGGIGVVLGVLIGNLVGVFLKAGFIMPWGWTFIGLAATFVVGLLAGWLPARKAALLDPVEALRYE